MDLQTVTTCIIVFGLLLTVYCTMLLAASYRVVVREIREAEEAEKPSKQDNG